MQRILLNTGFLTQKMVVKIFFFFEIHIGHVFFAIWSYIVCMSRKCSKKVHIFRNKITFTEAFRTVSTWNCRRPSWETVHNSQRFMFDNWYTTHQPSKVYYAHNSTALTIFHEFYIDHLVLKNCYFDFRFFYTKLKKNQHKWVLNDRVL